MTETLRLSVWIPTYNRLPSLRQSLPLLLPQLTPECELVILDNASDQDVASGIQDLIQDFHVCPVRVVRSPVNIGGNPNILRCLEQARGDWIWVLGDDDFPMPAAVASILKETRGSPALTLINFVTFCLELQGRVRKESVMAEGMDGLIQTLDSFSNLLFISSSVFNRRKIEKHIDQAYWYVSSCASHLALLLIVLRAQGGKVKLSATKIIDLQIEQMTWNRRVVSFSIQKLLELIPDRRMRTLWYQKSLPVLPAPLPSPVQILKIRLGFAKREDLVDDLELAAYLNHRVSGLRFKSFLIRVMASLPDFFLPLFRVVLPWARRLTGKSLALIEDYNLVQARFNDIRK